MGIGDSIAMQRQRVLPRCWNMRATAKRDAWSREGKIDTALLTRRGLPSREFLNQRIGG